MTKKRRSSSEQPPRQPTTLRISVADAEAQLRERIEKASALMSGRVENREAFERVRAQYYTWDEYNTTLLERIFTSPEIAQEYSYWGMVVVGGPSPLSEEVGELHRDLTNKIRRLESIIERLPLYSPNAGETATQEAKNGAHSSMSTPRSRNVFVVHGRNNELKETVARFLAQLDLRPIILHEQPSGGRTVIEKFETHSDASFAVVLLTPDDMARLATDSDASLQPRARQNVIFEWGFFVAKLGRRNVCALYAEGVELPSDVGGVVYVELDRNGAWKMLLARELKAAGIEVDLNRAI